MTADPYEILGISPDASEDEIKKKYRALVKEYHPDLHPGDEAAAKKMSEINEAYELIRSGEAKQYRSAASTSGASPMGTYSQNGQTYYYQYVDPEEIFNSFFSAFGMGGFSTRHSYTDPYERVAEYINMGALNQAASILEGIYERDGKWNYYAAMICAESGRYNEAAAYADAAARMEPLNEEYSSLAKKLHEYSEKQTKIISHRRNIFALLAVGFSLLFLINILSPLFYLFAH